MESTEVAVALARIETKLDNILSSISDHEARIRTIEATPTVSPKQLAAWLTLLLLVVSTVGPFLLAVL